MLSYRWDCNKKDVFVFDFEKLAEYTKSLPPVTKRNILKVTAKLFDPLGITSPIIIKNKILFQKLSKQDWDEPVDKTIQRDWFKWVSDLLEIKWITIPRCYFNFIEGILGSTLYTFCDASVLTFASVVYLVIQTSTDYHCCLVTSNRESHQVSWVLLSIHSVMLLSWHLLVLYT